MTTRHSNPEIAEYLEENGYESIEEWMSDSDYRQDVNGTWWDENENRADPEDSILTAIEAANG